MTKELKIMLITTASIMSVMCPMTKAENNNLQKNDNMKFPLVELEYAKDALEPYIDEDTVYFHHDKHQAAYVEKLNAAISSDPTFICGGSLTMMLSELDKVPEHLRTAIRNNGGGAWNHEFYWKGLSPNKSYPSKTLMDAIDKTFGSFENFKKQMSASATNHFGSGWAWLGVDGEGKLKICSTPNQDSPIMGKMVSACDMIPILTIDVWEHAYYLKYQNLRGSYLEAIWNVINWDKVSKRYEHALKEKKTML